MKAQLKVVGTMVILLVVVFTVIFIIRQKAESAGALMTTKELKVYREGCEFRAKALKLQNPELLNRLDRDLTTDPSHPLGDGYPDSCDFCIGGDDRIDNDDDGIPEACDDNDDPLAGGARKSGISLRKICTDKCTNARWIEDSLQCDIRRCTPRTP